MEKKTVCIISQLSRLRRQLALLFYRMRGWPPAVVTPTLYQLS